MKILMTGASGAIGPMVVAELEKEHDLHLFGRRKTESLHAQTIGELTSIQDCRAALEGAQAVVHLAAYSKPAPDAFRFNMESTYALLEACRQLEIKRFIFASTNCVYGQCFPLSKRDFPLQYLPIDETHPCMPEDNYGLSKILCEQMIATYSQNWGMQTASLRLSWVWGPKELDWRRGMETLDTARFAPYFWSYVDGRDATCAIRLALDATDLPAFGTYNIQAADHMAENHSQELVDLFYSGVPLRRPFLARESFFDIEKAREAFGYAPRHSWLDTEN